MRETAFSSAMLVDINGRCTLRDTLQDRASTILQSLPPNTKVSHRSHYPIGSSIPQSEMKGFQIMILVYSCGGEPYYWLNKKGYAIYNASSHTRMHYLTELFPQTLSSTNQPVGLACIKYPRTRTRVENGHFYCLVDKYRET